LLKKWTIKKWTIVFIVLACTIFAVSSGCSEKSKENTTQGVVENGKENVSRNSEGETNLKAESTNSANWCAVGSHLSQMNPTTGEMFTMKITGLETIDGVPMCKSVGEMTSEDGSYSKLEYLWSQDGKTSTMTGYNKSGDKIYEASLKDGKMKIVDKDGKVTEFTTNS